MSNQYTTSPSRSNISIDDSSSLREFHLETASNASDPMGAPRPRSRQSQSVTSLASSRPAGSVSSVSGGGDNVTVVCRVRPFNAREIQLQEETNEHLPAWEKQELRSVITMEGSATQFLDVKDNYCMKEQFQFDENIWSIPREQQASNQPFASQEDVFNRVGRPTLEHTFEGYHTCLFAYGQTGSGKTYSMMGFDGEEKGLIPRVCESLFEKVHELKNQKQNADTANGTITESFKVEATFLEIYNEHVKDLLWELGDPDLQEQEKWDGDNLKVRHVPGQGPYVVGLTHVNVDSWDHCQQLLDIGTENRSMAATKMNDRSSRSHALFRISLTQTTTLTSKKQFEKPKVTERTSNINLVDLAGSERNKKSGAQGQRLKEAAAINQSLTTLKNVIDALVEHRPVIPYRESQLTWLLSESLGGNSKTFMIACVSPHSDNADETLNTLRYALRTQGIVCHARVNESDEAKKIARLRQELEKAQQKLVNAEESEKQQLLQDVEEKRVAVTELQRARFLKMSEMDTLQDQLEKERESTYAAVYSHAFRVILCERLAQRVAYNKEQLRTDVDIVNRDITRREVQLNDATKKLKKAQHDENDAEVILESKQRTQHKLQEAATALEQRRRELEHRDDEQKKQLKEKAALYHRARFCCAALTWHAQVSAHKVLDDQATTDSKEIEAAALSNDDDMNAYVEQRKLQLNQKRKENLELRKKIAQTRLQLHSRNVGKTAVIRKLHEAAIFYDRENKQLDEERVTELTELHARRNKEFEVESATSKADLAAAINESRHEYHAMMRELSSQHAMAKAEASRLVKEANDEGEDAYTATVTKIEEDVQRALDACTAKDHRKSEQITETQRFLKQWNGKKEHYVPLAAQLNRKAQSILRFDASPYDATEVAKDLLQKNPLRMGALQSVTPAPFTTPESREISNTDAARAMAFPMSCVDKKTGKTVSELEPPQDTKMSSLRSTNFARVDSVLTSFQRLASSVETTASPVPKLTLPGREDASPKTHFAETKSSVPRVSLPTNPPSYAFARSPSSNNNLVHGRSTTPRTGRSTSRCRSPPVSTTTPRSTSSRPVSVGTRACPSVSPNRTASGGSRSTTANSIYGSTVVGADRSRSRDRHTSASPQVKKPNLAWR